MSSLTTFDLPYNERARRTPDSPIAGMMKTALEIPGILSLAAGFVDQSTLPHDLLQAAFDKVFGQADAAQAALQYGTTPGLRRLREAQAKRLESQGLKNVDPDHLVISNGGQQSLFCITETLVEKGDIVLVEDPTYFVYMDVLNSAGALVLGVSTDEQGMRPDALEERLREIRSRGLRDRLKILYLMSYYANPLGSNMSAERRRAIYDVFQKELGEGPPFLLIEDAAYRDLCLDGPDEPFLKALDPENQYVATVGTFSKALAPGLRLGWSYLPPALHTAVCRQKANQEFGSSNLCQNILTELLENGAYEVAAQRFRDRYRKKRDAMLSAIDEFWPSDTWVLRPKGGLYVWCRLPGISTEPDSPFLQACLEEKVIYVPGKYCYPEHPQEPRPTDAIRLTYGVIGLDDMREALRRMGRVAEKMG